MKKIYALILSALIALTMLCGAMAEGAVTPGDAAAEPTAAPTQAPAPEKGAAGLGNMQEFKIERKKTVTLAVPVIFRAGSESWYSNMLSSGSIVQYDPTRSAIGYSDDIFDALSSLTVEIAQTGDMPFYKKSIPSRRTVIGTLNDSTAKELGFEKAEGNTYRDPLNGKTYAQGTRFNAGFGVFSGLVVSSSVRNGSYDIPVKIRWESEIYGSGSASVTVKATAENSDVEETTSSGGGGYYYSGGGGSTSNTPAAKLIISSVSTNPATPTAGEEFDLILKLHNTSETAPVSNITINCEAESDAVLPVSGAFGAYVEGIAAGKALEQRIRVRAQSNIADEPVKIYVSIDYEDKSANALNVTQTVVINVAQLMRIKLDDPVLPSDASVAGESYPVTMGVFNLGRTTLYNVTVEAQTQDANLSTARPSTAATWMPAPPKRPKSA